MFFCFMFTFLLMVANVKEISRVMMVTMVKTAVSISGRYISVFISLGFQSQGGSLAYMFCHVQWILQIYTW